MKEPLWKTVLCWGAVILYLTIPVVTYAMIVVSIELPWLHINEHLRDFQGLKTWFQALTALIFGMAGLNTWDRTVRYNGKQQEKKQVLFTETESKDK